jgi:SMC interacting uncharacterized protein involved in chromosome segregation
LQAGNEPPPDHTCPRGTRMLTEEEKEESIAILSDQKEELLARLAKMPLTVETPTLVREKKMLEIELDEIDKSIDQLKRKYVFVPID